MEKLELLLENSTSNIESLQDSVTKVNHLTEQEWITTRVIPKIQSNGHYSVNPGATAQQVTEAISRTADCGHIKSNSSIRCYTNWNTKGIHFLLLMLFLSTIGIAQAIPKSITSPARVITEVKYFQGSFIELLDNGDSIVTTPGKCERAKREFTARITSDATNVWSEAFGNAQEWWVIYWRSGKVEAIARGLWTPEDWRRIYLFETGKGFQVKPPYIK